MKVNQIYSLLNDINAQMFGESAIDVHDLGGIVSLGNAIVGNTDNTDLFLGKLVDRIGKTVIRTLDLELDFPKLYMDSFEFGCILEKITVNPFSAIQANEYNVPKNDFTPSLLDVRKPEIMVRYFQDGIDVWSFQCTIPDDLFTSAFTSESKMGQFIDAIIGAMTDSMTMALNNMSRTAVNNLIAEKLVGGHGVVNLLALYNATLDSPITAAQAMVSKEFYRFAANTIRKYIKYMKEPSVLYNEGDVLRATSRDNMHVLMLTDFVAGFESYLSSDTFHNELLGMPLYQEVTHWQGNKGSGSENTFAVNSSINVYPSSQKDVAAGDKYAINQSGIVCVLADRQAVAVGLNNRRSGSFYNSIDFYSNIKSSAKMQFINDLTENMICFVVASEVATPSITLDKSTLTFANSSAADQTITATVKPSGSTVTWKSSDTDVATVAAGVVSAAGAGTCTITASITVGGVKYEKTCAVTVGSSNSKSK